jgi:nitrate reductase NapE component
MSVGAATAISSATVVFEFLFLVPFLYPVLSVVLVQLLKRRYGGAQPSVRAA